MKGFFFFLKKKRCYEWKVFFKKKKMLRMKGFFFKDVANERVKKEVTMEI